MQKKTLVLFLSSFALQFLSAGEPFMFVKRVENNIDRCNLENILPDGSVEVLYNLGSKSDLERLFFDRFNAPVEFFFRPDPGMNRSPRCSRSANLERYGGQLVSARSQANRES